MKLSTTFKYHSISFLTWCREWHYRRIFCQVYDYVVISAHFTLIIYSMDLKNEGLPGITRRYEGFCIGCHINIHVMLYFIVIMSLIIICVWYTVLSMSWRYGIISLTHWGRDKMAAIFQTTFPNAFFNEIVLNSIKISRKFVPKGPNNYIPALV